MGLDINFEVYRKEDLAPWLADDGIHITPFNTRDNTEREYYKLKIEEIRSVWRRKDYDLLHLVFDVIRRLHHLGHIDYSTPFLDDSYDYCLPAATVVKIIEDIKRDCVELDIDPAAVKLLEELHEATDYSNEYFVFSWCT